MIEVILIFIVILILFIALHYNNVTLQAFRYKAIKSIQLNS